MHTAKAKTIGSALTQLRKAILLCSWAVGICLAIQVLIWSLATFTGIRWEEPVANGSIPLIIESDMIPQAKEKLDPAQAIRAAAGTDSDSASSSAAAMLEPLENELVLSGANATLQYIFRCARGIGTAGMILMFPFLLICVIVTVTSAMPGCEKTLGAFIFCSVVALLVLPLGEVLSLPWSDGALTSYAHMTSQVDAYENNPATALGPFVFFARFLLLPAASVIGVFLIWLRFSASVDIAVLAADEHHVDPNIEMEASRVQMGDASGSRAARAISQMVTPPGTPKESDMPIAGQVSPGKMPKRLI